MAEENNNNETTETETTETDIFQQQKKVIDTLVDELARQGQAGTQPVYVSPPVELEQKTTNYVLYAGMAIVAILLFKK